MMNTTVKKITILVVEDTLSEMELISHYLREGGFAVVNAMCARQAMAMLISNKPDLIITDVVMPEMSGFELCRNLKKDINTAKIPVVICSSKNQEIDKLWAMKQGASAYLIKPFTREDLLRSIQSVLLTF